jgi:hypothetical protein
MCRSPQDGAAPVCTQRCFSDLPELACPGAETCRAADDGGEACFAAAGGGCSAGRGQPGLLLLVLLQLLRGRGRP